MLDLRRSQVCLGVCTILFNDLYAGSSNVCSVQASWNFSCRERVWSKNSCKIRILVFQIQQWFLLMGNCHHCTQVLHCISETLYQNAGILFSAVLWCFDCTCRSSCHADTLESVQWTIFEPHGNGSADQPCVRLVHWYHVSEWCIGRQQRGRLQQTWCWLQHLCIELIRVCDDTDCQHSCNVDVFNYGHSERAVWNGFSFYGFKRSCCHGDGKLW